MYVRALRATRPLPSVSRRISQLVPISNVNRLTPNSRSRALPVDLTQAGIAIAEFTIEVVILGLVVRAFVQWGSRNGLQNLKEGMTGPNRIKTLLPSKKNRRAPFDCIESAESGEGDCDVDQSYEGYEGDDDDDNETSAQEDHVSNMKSVTTNETTAVDIDNVTNTTTLADVAGIEEAKREVTEVIDFIRFPEVYIKLGAKMPKGILLCGPPGCGKTLLARAIAGEAEVPMIITSGSEFIEMFVGVGAARIRQVFEEAKKQAPCIIFIDEIDSIGRQRSAGTSTSSAEQDQTINQLLTEMDGFEKNGGILVIAATNRPDILDNALTRPGRFDRVVTISMPSVKGRADILRVHTKSKPLAPDVRLESLARITKGFTGAELESLCNEAAIYAARQRRTTIDQACFDVALDKALLGLELESMSISEDKRCLIAYHEAGHALLGVLMSDFDVVKKISIVPRGGTGGGVMGGVTLFEPLNDNSNLALYTQQYLENQLVVALGGRVAEELKFGKMRATTGAYGDFQKVQKIARDMVTQYGFNQNLGPGAWTPDQATSGNMANEIDREVSYLVNWAYDRATQLLTLHEGYLDKIKDKLMESGTISDLDLLEVLEGIGCDLRIVEREI